MDKNDYLAEVSNRLAKLFRASKEGCKIPDIDRHRLEGFLHAGIFMKIATTAETSALLEDVHYSIFGKTIRDRNSEKLVNWSDIEIDYDQFDQPTYLR
jgi:hypothetical protein